MIPRILVLYGTTDGHTAKVAAAIDETLRSEGASVSVVDAKTRGTDPDPEDYEAVIVAASVHGGAYQREVQRWVRTHAPALNSKPGAFVSVCLAVLERSPKTDRKIQEILQRFFEQTHWTPSVSKVVAGALPYTKYGWLKRWIMRRIVAKAHGDTDTTHDFEYTDWKDLEAFVREFHTSINAGVPAKVAI